ncbi:MAG: hypothetical protein OXH04_00615 [Acidobacteria bacterium]|nr:hypothetical protein [Acidobacteriota bacterium]
MPGVFIANPLDDQPDAMPLAPSAPRGGSSAGPARTQEGEAHRIEVAARCDGTFTVTNRRDGFSRTDDASP